MATFTYTPSYAPTCDRRPRVLSTRFGDGYEQRGADGINSDLQSWKVTFADRTTTEADAIELFFTANNTSVSNFTWTPPNAGAAKRFICRQWTRTTTYFDGHTITATFDEVPEP